MFGVVGGVGSGKSALCSAVAERWDLAVLDGDAAGHEALREDAVKIALHDRFGAEIFFAHGDLAHREIDRSKLAAKVFGPGKQAALAALEAIVHPVIRRRLLSEAEDLLASGYEAVLLDAAVLLETGWRDLCEKVVFVDVPRSERLRRVASRGWDAAELDRRETSQWSLDRKRAAADATVDNGGLLADAVRSFDDLLQAWGVEPSPAAPVRAARPDLFAQPAAAVTN
ncbi:dephospho-CoA kinase [Alienimonas chondri]|uniref:Dephospho-CoA kinase n=1 Tax=Alienimonas chondri TaxID=2681879 RepID=A0ABX1V6W6_9PLAN|nr:dephospho-CoA kinase [Alienimonas chondri]NNJ24024.1 Dephospho-CoA kinase [Alienimonas chondri]